ncbi:cell division protein FtsQ/DivIB [Streptomyces aidingensis]|uniref:cell division protein FtsQ/DivIB n=1 Tax=Streptomyces aidingensis TaxID=910347 RepID=UPI001587C7E5|nr:FtsQ-type POTRA domain-containing protein [Streptomyces aidingensis]
MDHVDQEPGAVRAPEAFAGTGAVDDDAAGAAGGAAPPRRRRRLSRRGLLLVTAVLLAALGGFGGWALYASSWLRVDRVTVSWTGDGPRALAADRIAEAAAVPVGEPMARLDKDAVRDRLLAALPRLKDAEVVRSWPDRVVVKVTERQAVVLRPGGDGFTEIDVEGVAFGVLPEAVPGVPLLSVELEHNAGVRRFGEDRIVTEAVGVVAALPPALHRRTEMIRVRSYDSLTLELTDGRTVRWGSPELTGEKVAALTAVMKAADGARYFDVSVPSAPAVFAP